MHRTTREHHNPGAYILITMAVAGGGGASDAAGARRRALPAQPGCRAPRPEAGEHPAVSRSVAGRHRRHQDR